MPVVTLLASWGMGLKPPNMRTLFNVSFIVLGVVIASFGEIHFVLTGFLFQAGGIVFEAMRLTLVERLLSSAEFKMDPLVSFYYFAPVCALMNGCVALFTEIPKIHMADITNVGLSVLLANAMLAFGLNVCVVFLVCKKGPSHAGRMLIQTQIGKTSSLVMTLCGVLKDILLVVGAITFMGESVSGLQVFGYSIALAGMVYYKLGAESIKGFFTEGTRQWAEYGVNHPAQRKMIVFGAIILTIILLLGGLAPTMGYQPSQVAGQSKDYLTGAWSTGNNAPVS